MQEDEENEINYAKLKFLKEKARDRETWRRAENTDLTAIWNALLVGVDRVHGVKSTTRWIPADGLHGVPEHEGRCPVCAT